jgi:hypothetical protein
MSNTGLLWLYQWLSYPLSHWFPSSFPGLATLGGTLMAGCWPFRQDWPWTVVYRSKDHIQLALITWQEVLHEVHHMDDLVAGCLFSCDFLWTHNISGKFPQYFRQICIQSNKSKYVNHIWYALKHCQVVNHERNIIQCFITNCPCKIRFHNYFLWVLSTSCGQCPHVCVEKDTLPCGRNSISGFAYFLLSSHMAMIMWRRYLKYTKL